MNASNGKHDLGRPSENFGRCALCGHLCNADELVASETIRPRLLRLIKRERRDWSETDFICLSDLNRIRMEYVRQVLEAEVGEVGVLEEEVVKSLKEHELIASNVETEFETQRTMGERLSDLLATFGGSWIFLILFGLFLVAWAGWNLLQGTRAIDPYPFILLNLLLSCLAAMQAPIIMMSQKRQESRDRLRSISDYQVNLKAELEIRHLHEKVDHLLRKQAQRLFEIQQIQLELMRDLAGILPRAHAVAKPTPKS